MYRSVLISALVGSAAAFAPSAPLGGAATGRAVGTFDPPIPAFGERACGGLFLRKRAFAAALLQGEGWSAVQAAAAGRT